MFELACCLAIVGGFLALITVPYFLFICIMFAVYKATNGKMSFREYVNHW